MRINSYDQLSDMHKDVLKEIGSIGTGNAATALSSLLSMTVTMTVPDVKVLGYNEAIASIGSPEEIIAGVLVRMSGEINGIMLYLQKLNFVQMVLGNICNEDITDYSMLGEMETSALEETGNIIISSYINALSKLTDLSVNLSVPGIAVNMLGGIMTVPMAEMGYVTDKLMIIDGKFICNGIEMSSHLLMMPDVESLNYLMEKLGINYE